MAQDYEGHLPDRSRSDPDCERSDQLPGSGTAVPHDALRRDDGLARLLSVGREEERSGVYSFPPSATATWPGSVALASGMGSTSPVPVPTHPSASHPSFSPACPEGGRVVYMRFHLIRKMHEYPTSTLFLAYISVMVTLLFLVEVARARG